eukprot:2269827-Rhodomonas_salina.2
MSGTDIAGAVSSYGCCATSGTDEGHTELAGERASTERAESRGRRERNVGQRAKREGGYVGRRFCNGCEGYGGGRGGRDGGRACDPLPTRGAERPREGGGRAEGGRERERGGRGGGRDGGEGGGERAGGEGEGGGGERGRGGEGRGEEGERKGHVDGGGARSPCSSRTRTHTYRERDTHTETERDTRMHTHRHTDTQTHTQTHTHLSSYASTMRCPVPTRADRDDGGSGSAAQGKHPYLPTRLLCVSAYALVMRICLRACYALPGTDRIAYSALLSAYALATQCPVVT